jgi:hypothetical protein
MKTIYFIILLASTQILNAQSPNRLVTSDNHKNEFGIANSPVFIIKEKEFAYGLHLHYIRSLTETKFGLGVGYERIFDEHKHNTIGVILSYAPIEHLDLSLSPGITFNDNDASELNFGAHFEILYEFEIGVFHFGPVAEFAYSVEDYHISLGLHFGFGF